MHSRSDIEDNPFLAANDLGQLLWDGSLRLFLGSGVSRAFGLPDWRELILRVLGKDRDRRFRERTKSKSIQELQSLIDSIDTDDDKFRDRVRDALYRDVNETSLVPQLQRSPLLLAVGALMTGVTRGRVTSVVTYNYDDLLEQYMLMLGLTVCVRTMPSDLSRRADIVLNYVHGRVPQRESVVTSPSRILLSEDSYSDRRSEIDEGWSDYIQHGLHSKIALFLGLSGDDGTIKDVMRRSQRRISRGSEYYRGYWILTPNSYKKNKESIAKVGMCPIKLKINEIPQFIFTICQKAMG
jgi:predicted Zn-dependent protease with MMP-like domain